MDVTVQDDRLDGPHGQIPIRRYTPAIDDGPSEAPTVVWLHGGGFYKGGLDQPEADSVAREIAANGYPVVSVDYRLVGLPLVGRLTSRGASSNRYPVPLDDVVAVVRHVSEHARSGIILGGASAGACLAASSARRFQKEGGSVAGLILAYGFFHFSHPRSTEVTHRPRGHRRLTHSRWALNIMNRNYVGTARPADEYAFVGDGDLRDFPRSLFINAERDGMRVSAELFADALESAGSPVERHVVAGSRHAFLNHPEADHFSAGISIIVDWLNSVRREPGDDVTRTRGSIALD